MVNIEGYLTPLISGIIIGLGSWLPMSPDGYSVERVLSLLSPGYADYLVPAYLGTTFAVFFYFRERIASGSQRVLMRAPDSDVRYLVYASLFTVLIGYPVMVGPGTALSRSAADLVNALVGAMLLGLSLLFGRFRCPLKRVQEKLRAESGEPTLIDSVAAGLAQGAALLGGISRSGLVVLGLVCTGVGVKRTLELSFLIAPAYFITRLLFIRWDPVLPVSLLFASFLTAFAASMLAMNALIKFVDVMGERAFLGAFGMIPVIVYLLGVVL
ncbi:undecaprenyl-diphosphate phosphatase [Thermococcus sp. M36]|uniref:undecaprenyl-diphosphate phosphatase n=1 Tax=Thermococcus sp. M36 TaxID=1638261 RepID=UPI00143C4305|nr:undecaprenyl-diphosphate phosphatase [Thermococcus sp. M36]NJE06395.1 undecaprenyl-diphosphate phosphatase [Thermococcus sp. M36]